MCKTFNVVPLSLAFPSRINLTQTNNFTVKSIRGRPLMTSHSNGGEGVTRFVTNCDKGEGGVSSFVMPHESY